mgnify:FL=1
MARDGIQARWIQIFVRPRQADLEPGVQIVDLPVTPRGQWRHLVGNQQSGAPAFVHVLEGEARLAGQALRAGEGILLRTDAPALIQTRAATGLLLFLVAPDASITHAGTIGG